MFLIHTSDFFNNYNMILNDNIIDCFDTYSLNDQEASIENLDSKCKEILVLKDQIKSYNDVIEIYKPQYVKDNLFVKPIMPSKNELLTKIKYKYSTSNYIKEKLDKNEIYNYDIDYNNIVDKKY